MKKDKLAKKERKRLKRLRKERKRKEKEEWEDHANDSKQGMVEETNIKYRCKCGNRRFYIYSFWVKCTKCKNLYKTINQVAPEFNRRVKKGLNLFDRERGLHG